MNERLEGLKDWFAARGLPFEPAHETDSTTCSVRRERSKEGEGEEGSQS